MYGYESVTINSRAASGGDGSATANNTSGHVITGQICSVGVTYGDSPPGTTDVTIATAGNNGVIDIGGDIDGLVFNNNFISMGVANSEAIISVATGKDVTNCEVTYNNIYRLNTAGDLLIDSDTTANSGIVAHNRIGHADTASEVLIDADGVRQFDNLGSATDTASGYVLPAIDS